jgi:HAMP domain-containing protein/CHASE3 domain sensor protein
MKDPKLKKVTIPIPGAGLLGRLTIGAKLTIGMGMLCLLTLLVVLLSSLGDATATNKINVTDELRVPATLASARAQADLLKMLSDVRAYLALGEVTYRASYSASSDALKTDLAELKALAGDSDAGTQDRLRKMDVAIGQWSQLPDKMFQLRDDQLEREPAFKILMTDGAQYGGSVLTDVGKLIEAQGQREPTAANAQALVDMARFQASFAATMSSLQGYVTTRNHVFRGDFESHSGVNESDWNRLVAARDSLTTEQQSMLDTVGRNREAFLGLLDRLLTRLEGPDWRLDLFWFKTVAMPRANTMVSLLGEIADAQQTLLRQDLNEGRTGLARARLQSRLGGLAAIIVGGVLAWILGNDIAGRVRRLTSVAEQIRGGDLQAEARVESRDEIGLLAQTFNKMTSQLRDTLSQVKKEKKRADELLDVVIPIGVSLASETDYNRLLEEILLQAKSFCQADAGTLYLRAEDQTLEYVIVRNDPLRLALGGTAGGTIPFAPVPLHDPNTGEPNRCNLAARVAVTGTSINVANAAAAPEFDACGEAHRGSPLDDFVATSVLAVPLKSRQGHVLGVLQLLNARAPGSLEVIPFDANLQQMMESFSSLAVAALESYIRENRLRQQIQQLRIEIDEVKRQKEVSQIVDTDFFQDLQRKARHVRQRKSTQADAKGRAE